MEMQLFNLGRQVYNRKLCSNGKYGRLLLWADGHGGIVGADL